jgi:hypothetical protein
VEDHNLWVRVVATGERVKLSRDGEHFYDYATPLPSPTLMVQQGTEDVVQTPVVFWSPDSAQGSRSGRNASCTAFPTQPPEIPGGVVSQLCISRHFEPTKNTWDQQRTAVPVRTVGEMAMNHSHATDLLMRIQGEYQEMPGLRLTFAQAQRLWGLDRPTCESVITQLVERHVLCLARDGTVVRLDPNSPIERETPVTRFRRQGAPSVGELVPLSSVRAA